MYGRRPSIARSPCQMTTTALKRDPRSIRGVVEVVAINFHRTKLVTPHYCRGCRTSWPFSFSFFLKDGAPQHPKGRRNAIQVYHHCLAMFFFLYIYLLIARANDQISSWMAGYRAPQIEQPCREKLVGFYRTPRRW